jgi:hypothetical protein
VVAFAISRDKEVALLAGVAPLQLHL